VLTPSSADLAVASNLGNLGVGFLIVDNPVEAVYVVVEPHKVRRRAAIGEVAVEADLGDGGALAGTLPGYEYRESQVEMSRLVGKAFDEDGLAIVEAGTGTGKSFAYLFPAIRFAKANQGRAVVSTNTINLQTQLLEKDVPQVARALGEDVSAVLLKGRANYLCRRKLAEAAAEPGIFDDAEARGELERIAAWATTSEEGSRQGLGFVPRPEVWERIQSESDTTLRVKCPHYNECFYYQSRRRAATADLVVVNHHLLLSDLAVRAELGFGVSALLPPYDRLVVDEAHHLEDAATEHMASRVGYQGLQQLLGRLVSTKGKRRKRGRLLNLAGRLGELATLEPLEEIRRHADAIDGHVVPEHRRLLEDLARIYEALTGGFLELMGGQPPVGRELRKRVVPGLRKGRFWREVVRPRVAEAATRLTAYGELLHDRLRALNRLSDESLERLAGAVLEVRASARRVEERAAVLREFLDEGEDRCRWVEYKRTRTGERLRLCVAPVEVGPQLKELLFDRIGTAVLTSATLRTGEDFGYLEGRLGLSDAGARLETLALASPFDFATQAFVAVPADLALPNAPRFAADLADLVEEAVVTTHGHAFVLFTSYRLLRDVFDRAADRLRAYGLLPMRQGEEDRYRLLERFKREPGAVLFATASFWEGVDVPGDALRLVVLTKLPFAVPDEPILQARAEKIEARGGDAFAEYSLPQAVLRFRQGFGRLIRSRRDRGAVLITDRRVVERRYGAAFLGGLPTDEVRRGPAQQVLEEMRTFFEARPDQDGSGGR
jgi:ATP-dependent DNA helicase DinG